MTGRAAGLITWSLKYPLPTGESMAEIGLKELKSRASGVIDEVEGGRTYVVTKRGRPAAVLVPVEEAEDLVLANARELIDIRRRARLDYERGRSKSLREIG